MTNIFIDILGEPEDEPKEKRVAEAEPVADPRNRRLRKQVINIDGEVIDDPYA